MIFNSKIELDQKKAKERLQWLIDKKARFELTEKKPCRSLRQNSYMHLLFDWFGLQFGYTREEVKQDIFKKTVNVEIFYDGEKDGIVKIQKWRSTSKLDKGEMTTAINRFRNFSANEGCYLPEPEDRVFRDQIENEISQAKEYL